MKIRIMSDLHLEFSDFNYEYHGEDVLVAAGDLHKGVRAVEWLNEISKRHGVIVVAIPGNHEYYGGSWPSVHEKMRQASDDDVHILQNDVVEVRGVWFLGSTLWADFNGMGNALLAGLEAAERMNDYRAIRVAPKYRKLRVLDTKAYHRQGVDFLRYEMSKRQKEKVVVVSHHAPSFKSVAEQYQSEVLSAAYFSRLDDLIMEGKPDLWVHGHCHNRVDYRIGETRVICNPRGYPSEDTGFLSDLLVEI